MITPEVFMQRYNDFIEDLQERDIPLARGAQSSHADQVTRIFVEGKNSNGDQIGQYNDTKPLYADPNTTPGRTFKPQGKVSNFSAKKKGSGTGDTFKNGKPRKTKYFPSYKALKQVIGQESNFVNLEYTGDLKSDFSNRGQVIKVNNHEYVSGVRDYNAEKIEGQEKRFNAPIFEHTKHEVATFFDIAAKEFNLLFKRKVLSA